MALPDWIRDHLPPSGPRDALPDNDTDDIGITSCTCRGEGCTDCNGDGVIYP